MPLLQIVLNFISKRKKMEEQYNSRKRVATHNLQEDVQNKKIHIDPFAQLEQAMTKQEKNKANEEEQWPLLKAKIIHQIENQHWIHQTFYPNNFQRKQQNTNISMQHDLKELSQVQLSLKKIRQLQQSFVICGLSSVQSEKIIQSQIVFWKEKFNKILIVCSNERRGLKTYNFKIKDVRKHPINDLQNDKLQTLSYQCSVISITQLRRLSFSDLAYLNRFNVILWDRLQFDAIFQEVLITMPLNINYFFIFKQKFGNIKQFLQWLTRLRARPFHLLYQSKPIRPKYHVYGYPNMGQGLFRLINENGQRIQENIEKINQSLTSTTDKGKLKQAFASNLKKMMKLLFSLNYLPAILYLWSKAEIQRLGLILCESLDFTSKVQKQRIQLFFIRSQTILDEKERGYKNILLFRQFLVKGIAIYHKGLISLVKNLVELLWAEGLIKVLITDGRDRFFESKSMVIFANKKQGGIFSNSSKELVNYHLKLNGEQVQQKMFILSLDQKIDSNKLESFFLEDEINCSSSFDFTFHSFLNYQGFDDMDAKYILTRTLKQYQNHQQLQNLKLKQVEIQEQLDSILFQDIRQINSFNEFKEKQSKLQEQLKKLVYTPQRVVPFLNVGRLIKLADETKDWGYGIVVNIHKIQQKILKSEQNNTKTSSEKYLVDALICIQCNFQSGQPEPIQIDIARKMQVLTFDITCIQKITKISFTSLPNNLKSEKNRQLVLNSLRKLQNYKIAEIQFYNENIQILQIKAEIQKVNRQVQNLSYLMPIQSEYMNKIKLQKQLKDIRKQIKVSQKILYKKIQKCYHKLAKSIGMIEKGNLTQFGKAAATINNEHILLIIKMIKDDFFNNLSQSQTAALIVTLIKDQTINTQRLKVINIRLRQKINEMLQMSKQIAEVYRSSKLQFDQSAYIDNIKEKYVEVVYQWCQGEDFQVICTRFDIYQGNMIRILNSLLELIQNISNASQILNLQSLSKHFHETANAINRGVVIHTNFFE